MSGRLPRGPRRLYSGAVARVIVSTIAIFGAVGPPEAAADVIIWDQSVASTGATATGVFENRAAGQNFAEPVHFDSPVMLSGIDIYTATIPSSGTTYEYGAVGTPVIIRLRTGSATGPLQEFASVISLRDQDGASPNPVANGPPLERVLPRACRPPGADRA